MHPFVAGELAFGNPRDRESILELRQDLPNASLASPKEALMFIERHCLHYRRIGYVDGHLLASVGLMPGARLWTRDLRLRKTANWLGCAHAESAH